MQCAKGRTCSSTSSLMVPSAEVNASFTREVHSVKCVRTASASPAGRSGTPSRPPPAAVDASESQECRRRCFWMRFACIALQPRASRNGSSAVLSQMEKGLFWRSMVGIFAWLCRDVQLKWPPVWCCRTRIAHEVVCQRGPGSSDYLFKPVQLPDWLGHNLRKPTERKNTIGPQKRRESTPDKSGRLSLQ